MPPPGPLVKAYTDYMASRPRQEAAAVQQLTAEQAELQQQYSSLRGHQQVAHNAKSTAKRVLATSSSRHPHPSTGHMPMPRNVNKTLVRRLGHPASGCTSPGGGRGLSRRPYANPPTRLFPTGYVDADLVGADLVHQGRRGLWRLMRGAARMPGGMR